MKINQLISELKLVKGDWDELAHAEKTEVGNGLKNLVDTAYASTELGGFIKDQNDVNNSEWLALDWDEDDDIDTTVFYRKPRSSESWRGFKIQGIGHDNQRESKSKVVDKIAELITKSGWWIEASGAMRGALLKRNCPVIDDIKVIQKLFNDSSIEMSDKVSYRRSLPSGAKTETESVFGKPILK